MVPLHFLRLTRRTVCTASAILFALVAVPAARVAQDPIPTQPTSATEVPTTDVPAHLAVVDGVANLERDGRVVAAEENVPLLAGDRLRTVRGRVEVLFADGSALDIDQNSSVDLLSDSLIRLRTGRIRLSIVRVTEALEYRVDGAGASATIRTAGDYRLTITTPRPGESELDLAVLHGTAELWSPLGRTLVRAGTHAVASERTEPSSAYAFNASALTEFDQWVENERDARLGAESAQHLPTELRHYAGTLDQSGEWGYEQDYGNVWYPRVAETWSPYYDGRWSVVGSFGWTWIGADRWYWPTHHYGWWGWNGGRWFWGPGIYWSPGWVSWAVAPGYVSWCPLGFNGYAAVGFGKWGHGWTAVPANNFNTSSVAVKNTLVARTSQQPTATAFKRSSSPPVAVSRRTEPLRSPSASAMARGRAVPRTAEGVGAAGSARVAVSRSNSNTSTSGATRNSRVPDSLSSPTGSRSGRATSRVVMPPTPGSPDRTVAPRSPGSASQSRGAYRSAAPRTSPSAGTQVHPAQPRSTSRPPAAPDGYGGSSGYRRIAPPPQGGGSMGAPSSQPQAQPQFRAVPRNTPPPQGHSASPPPSRGGGNTAAPPPSSSSGSSGSGAARRTGRGGR